MHEELLKLYSSEKKSQNQRAFNRFDTRGSFTGTHEQVAENENQSNSQKGRRFSLRGQWAKSARAKTTWVPGVSNLERSGSFVSYINEGYVQVPNPTLNKMAVTKTMSLTEHEVGKEVLADTKCQSASQVKGSEGVFTFDKNHIENISESDNNNVLSNKSGEKEIRPCHDYVNINSLSLNSPTNSKGTLEENNHVSKTYLKRRQGDKIKHQYHTIDTEFFQADSRKDRRTSKEADVCDSNFPDTEGDYLSMDGVGNLRISVSAERTDKDHLDDTTDKTEYADELGDSGDYIEGDFQQTESKNYRTPSVESTVGDSNDACTDDDYLSMDVVEKIKEDVEKQHLVDRKEKNESIDDLGDSGDYVMGDFGKDQTDNNDSLYTDIEGNPIDDQYASIDVKPSTSRNSEESDDYVNVYPKTLHRVCAESQRENDLLPRDIESVYDVPPPFKNPTKLKLKSFETSDEPDGGSVVVNKEFYGYSVPEVVDCLNACALPHLASICKKERLDGYFFKNFDLSLLTNEPFLLNWFHIAKLRRVMSGWRPKQ